MTEQTDLIADLQSLNQIAEVLNRAVDVRGALDNALDALVDLMGMETGWIFLMQPKASDRWAGRGFELVAHHNLPPALALTNPEAWDRGCDCQTLCLKGRLNEAYNEVKCSRLADVSGDRRGLGIHASTPLRSGEKVLGILNVAASDWEAFSPRALALLTNVGSQMGIALERARLFDMLQEQRIHEQGVLLDLSNQLLGRSDLDEVMQYLVEEVSRLLQVDACALLLLSSDGQTLRFRAATGWRSDPVGHQYRVPLADSGSGKVMRTQQPIWVADSGDQETLPWMSGWLEEEGFEGAAIVPLITNGRSIGTLVIDSRHPRQFDEAEVRLLQLMANQAAIAIEKARLHQEEIQRHRMDEELAVGRQIQLSMLPPACPVVAGWEFEAVYEAARQVGGDFYDHFVLPDKEHVIGLVVADVSDKGVPAALFMALSRTAIRNTALRGVSPAEALCWANQYIQDDSQSDMFLSAFYGTLDTQNGRFHYTNAGHNPPLLWRAAANTFKQLRTDGIVLGVLPQVQLEENELDMAPRDVLVLYTDGVTEALNDDGEEFGMVRLRRAVATAVAQPEATAHTIAAAIMAAVNAFTGGAAQYDDMTLLIVRRMDTDAG